MMKTIILLFSLQLLALASVGQSFTISASVSISPVSRHHSQITQTSMSSNSDDNSDFWIAQKKLAESMSESVADSDGVSRQL